MTYYQIDEVAKRFGLTKRTLRYYEEIGLLFPPERTEGGFRQYTDKHLERVKQIVDTRDVLGSSLQEIQTFVEIREEINRHIREIKQTEDRETKYNTLLKFKEILDKQRDVVDRKMQKLNAIKEDTDHYYSRVTEAIKKYSKE